MMDHTVLQARPALRMHLLQALIIALVLLSPAFTRLDTAFAQVIIATVNNDPITNIDLEQRIKLQKVLRKPATSEAALDSLIDDRVKSGETKKYNIKLTDSEINHEIARVAGELKIDPNSMVAELEHAGVSADHFKAHFQTDYAFNLLVQALNKGVEASETEVRAELEKQGGKSASGIEYSVRQIILPTAVNAPPATVEARAHAAELIHTKFTDCATGVPMLQAMDDVVVRNPLSRSAIQLGEGLKQVLDKTPVGHVTMPQRTASGFEMLALCSRGASKDDTAAREAISQKILAAHYAAEEARLLKELRSHAVIQKK
jgi:peptidyl-prolyl cis-trans isomerase SurA